MKRPSDRLFGIMISICLCGLTGVIYLWTRHLVQGLLIAAGVIFTLGLLTPRILLPFNRIWSGMIAPTVGRLNNLIILGGIFYLVLTPLALFMRVFGRDPLKLRPDPNASTYFEPVDRQADAKTLAEVF